MVALKLGLVLFLVAANGFFVAAEFALVGVRRSRIETLAAAGKSTANRLLRLLNNLNAYLSASQLGITLASLGLGWVGEPVIARLLERPFAGLVRRLATRARFCIAFSIITIVAHRSGRAGAKAVWTCARRKSRAGSLAADGTFLPRVSVAHPRARLGQCAHGQTRSVCKPSPEHASSYTEAELRQLVDHLARERSPAR